MKHLLLILVLLSLPITVFAAGDSMYPTEDKISGKWGYTDNSGHWIISASFDGAEQFRGNYASVTLYPEGMEPEENGESKPCQGIINRQGKFVLPPEYYIYSGWYEGWGSFGTWEGGYYAVAQDEIYIEEGDGPVGFFDVRSGFFSGLKYSALWDGYGEGDLIPVVEVREDISYLGYADRLTGEIVLPCEYYLNWQAEVTTFPEGMGVLAQVAGFDKEESDAIPGEYMLMTRYGEVISLPDGIIPCSWADMSEGLIAVEEKDTELLGYADREGHIVITPQFERVYEFNQGEALVMLSDDQWALIDSKGNVLLREGDEEFPILLPEATTGKPFYAVQNADGLYGYIDTQGRIALPYQFAYAEDFRGDYAIVEVTPAVSADLTWHGLINSQGHWVFEPEKNLRISSKVPRGFEDFIGGKQDGIFIIHQNSGSTGYLDVQTGFFSGFIYDDVIAQNDMMDLSELIPVVMDHHLGYACRDTGEIVIPCKYDSSHAEGFWHGYAIVAYEDGDYLLIDQTGHEIYPPEDAVIEPYAWVASGLLPALSKKNGLSGYINTNGQWALPPAYEYASGFSVNGYANVRMPGNSWGNIDTEGTVQNAEYGFVSDNMYYIESQDSLTFYQADHTPLFSVSRPGICSCLGFNKHGVAWYEIQEPGESLSYRAGLMNNHGQVLTEPIFRLISNTDYHFHEGLSPAEDAESGLAGYVDETGKWVIQPVFDNSQLGSFHEGSAWVYRQEQRLLIDKTGNILYAEPIRRWVADDDG